jgi:hypothetical protein
MLCFDSGNMTNLRNPYLRICRHDRLSSGNLARPSNFQVDLPGWMHRGTESRSCCEQPTKCAQVHLAANPATRCSSPPSGHLVS